MGFKVTFLGTGTSQGVPVIACDCEVCNSTDPKDKRLRSSVLLSFEDKNIIIDTGPDFRQQMLANNVQHLEAVLYTHVHKDHIAGMDDIRPFNFKSGKPMELFLTDEVLENLKREFYYVFSDFDYPGIPQVNINLISQEKFDVLGEKIIPIDTLHYKLPVKAFRIRNFTYITDANYISEDEFKKIEGSEVVVINALRKKKHISHFNLKEALEMIERINPEKAYLTHISHLMGKHEDVSGELPDNVFIAYDNLQITLE